MASETANYHLVTGVVGDDFVEPEHNNRVADTVDRVMGNYLLRLMTAGAYDGWEITAAKQVDAGEGLVAACWCSSGVAGEVDGLTVGAVNYVFAQTGSTSGADGSVTFQAQQSASGPSGSVFLGTIELDAQGDVVEIDNAADGVDRQCYALAWRSLSGSGVEAAVPASGEVSFDVIHEALRVPGAIAFAVEGEDFTWEIDRTYLATGFRVTATNNGAAAADLVYSWEREGIGV